jgi:hypothetical protein
VSILHYIKCIPGIKWPVSVPERGQHIRQRGVLWAVGTHESLTVAFDPTLGMEPIVLSLSVPWTPPLPVTTVILSKDDALRALDVALADE